MKVILFNGSPNSEGCTNATLEYMEKMFNEREIETEIFHIGGHVIGGCRGCGACSSTGKCIQYDCVNLAVSKLNSADGFVFASPVHYALPTGDMIAFLDRLFYVGAADMRYKPAGIVTVARRGGCSSAFDAMIKYPTYNQMPLVNGDYWPIVYAHANPEQLEKDKEGLFTLATITRNMVWLMRCIESGRKAGIEVEYVEKDVWTNFVE